MRVNLRSALLAALSSAALGLTSHAQAHESDAGNAPRQVRVSSDPSKLRSKRYGALELRLAPYFPAVDREFSSATPYRDAFGKGPSWTFGLEVDWQIFHIPHLGSLGPGLAWHFGWKNGTAPFTDPNTPGESAHPQRMWIMPMYAVAVFRLDVLKQDLRIPLVPYAKFGLAVNMWEARDGHELSTANDIKGKGLEYGWTGHLGLMLHLNPLSPQSATDMDVSVGVNDAYLFVEWWYSDVSSFGKGMQVGSNTLSLGLTAEF